ncbi:hypothetical protein [uncultured Nocardioides sp.]|uniref:hypothetical protein n=1 Tax=uncultured Nocardioides sp. TaxID=198441 RepID=UPI002636B891|nr:hypothetical protein [uncultured Nocardioides sp.]
MTDHVRRAVVVVLTALALLVAPQIAHAAFLGTASQSMTVSTATLTEPGNVGLTNQCSGNFLGRGVTVTVSGSSGNDFTGVEFAYALYRGSSATPVDSETSTSRSATLSVPAQLFAGGSFRVTIQPRLRSWTGPTFTRTITC